MTLTQTDLNQLQCAECVSDPGRRTDHEHDALFLHARCHIDSATWTSYHEGVLTIECAECGKVICEIAVQP